jgi:MFS family permease
MIDTGRSMFYPSIIWAICIDSILISMQIAAGQVASSILLSRGWKFRLLGLSVIPIVLATPFVWLIGGWMADKVANRIALKRGGHREPESHLITLALPLILSVFGTVLFGYAGQEGKSLHWIVSMISIFLVALSVLSSNTIIAVYAVESYPQMPGLVSFSR